jgi:surface protein
MVFYDVLFVDAHFLNVYTLKNIKKTLHLGSIIFDINLYIREIVDKPYLKFTTMQKTSGIIRKGLLQTNLEVIVIEYMGDIEWVDVDGNIKYNSHDYRDFRGCITILVLNMFTITKKTVFSGVLKSIYPDTSAITLTGDMSRKFYSCTKFDSSISLWDTSRVTNMTLMFSFTPVNCNLSRWDTSRVTNMSKMFYGARMFNRPLGRWDTSNVSDMSNMFNGAVSFNQDISEWDISNVVDMSSMFRRATTFNRSIGNWDTSRVDNLSGMFEQSHSFNQPLDSWDTSGVESMYGLFWGARSFNQPIGRWDTSRVTNMSAMFYDASIFNQPLGAWDISKVCTMAEAFWGATNFNQSFERWDTSKIVEWRDREFADIRDFNMYVGLR